jgi:hypothetical protein
MTGTSGLAVWGVVGIILLSGCVGDRRQTSATTRSWIPWVETIQTPSRLTEALEARWTIERLHTFCLTEKPVKALQNLVTMNGVWKGTLYQGNGDLPNVWWYANVTNGFLDKYSLNMTKGRKHWIVEIGNQESLRQPPDQTAAK